jgi:hypothetical protein
MSPVPLSEYLGEFAVVEPRSSERSRVHVKAERFNQMEAAAAIGAEANDVTRVGRDFWLKENNIKHVVAYFVQNFKSGISDVR